MNFKGETANFQKTTTYFKNPTWSPTRTVNLTNNLGVTYTTTVDYSKVQLTGDIVDVVFTITINLTGTNTATFNYIDVSLPYNTHGSIGDRIYIGSVSIEYNGTLWTNQNATSLTGNTVRLAPNIMTIAADNFLYVKGFVRYMKS